ncbi:MAG: hypothetical protein ACOX8W_08005 [bacterium]|jgi:phytoene/squalene synthetase
MLRLADYREEQVRMIVDRISNICLSNEFHALREELEAIYERCGIEDAVVTAFQDALYTMLTQSEDEAAVKSHAH